MASHENIRTFLAVAVLISVAAVMVYASNKVIRSSIQTKTMEEIWRHLKSIRDRLDDTEINQADTGAQAMEQQRVRSARANKAGILLTKLLEVESEKDKVIADLLAKSGAIKPVTATMDTLSRSKRDVPQDPSSNSNTDVQLKTDNLVELFPDFDIQNIRYAEGSSFLASRNMGVDENDPNWEQKFAEEARTAVGRGENYHDAVSLGLQSSHTATEINNLVRNMLANNTHTTIGARMGGKGLAPIVKTVKPYEPEVGGSLSKSFDN